MIGWPGATRTGGLSVKMKGPDGFSGAATPDGFSGAATTCVGPTAGAAAAVLNVITYGALPSPWRVICPAWFFAAMKYSTLPCAMAPGICASQLSPSVRVSGVLMKVVLPCGRACSTATATGDSLRIFMRTVKSRPSGGCAVGLLCSMAGGRGAVAAALSRGRFGSRGFLGGASLRETALSSTAAPPTATAFAEVP